MMSTESVTEDRLSKFKNRGKNLKKLREKRIAECVELRKTQKSESFLKRRRITLSSLPDEDALSPVPDVKAVSATVEGIRKDVTSNCREAQIRGCQIARKLLAQEHNAPVKDFIEAGLLPRFVAFLSMNDEPMLQFEAAWALTNVASGTSWYTQKVGYLRNLTWTLSNMCRNKNPFPAMSAVQQGDFKTKREAVWAVANLTSGGTVAQVVQLVQSGGLEAIINLLKLRDTKTVMVILEAINNMFMAAEKIGETEKLCLLVEELGGLDQIEILQNHDNEIVYQAAHNLIEKFFE